MSRFGGDPVAVSLGACQCPGTPHEGGDEVYLLPRLSLAGGAAASRVVARFVPLMAERGEDAQDPDLNARFGLELGKVYIQEQTTGWNLTGEAGPLPFSTELLLSDWATGRPVADAADDLYSKALLDPLVEAVSTSSRDGPTAGSTSPSRTTSRTRRKR